MKFNFFKKSAFAVVMAAALLGGCKKEDPTPPAAPTCILTEEVDKNGGKEVYTTDASGRVILMTELNPSGEEKGRTTFTYNTAGKLIKATGYENGAEDTRMEFTYDGDKVSRMNLYQDNNGTMEIASNATFTYDGSGRNTGMKMFVGNSTTEVFSEEEYVYDSRGNLTKKTGYSYDGAERTLDYTTELTYDDKRSPMGTVNFPSLGMIGTTINNILTEAHKDEAGTVIYSVTNVYEYDSNNLPVKQTSTSSGGQMSDITTYIYNCK